MGSGILKLRNREHRWAQDCCLEQKKLKEALRKRACASGLEVCNLLRLGELAVTNWCYKTESKRVQKARRKEIQGQGVRPGISQTLGLGWSVLSPCSAGSAESSFCWEQCLKYIQIGCTSWWETAKWKGREFCSLLAEGGAETTGPASVGRGESAWTGLTRWQAAELCEEQGGDTSCSSEPQEKVVEELLPPPVIGWLSFLLDLIDLTSTGASLWAVASFAPKISLQLLKDAQRRGAGCCVLLQRLGWDAGTLK